VAVQLLTETKPRRRILEPKVRQDTVIELLEHGPEKATCESIEGTSTVRLEFTEVLELARKLTGRTKVIAVPGGFHGVSLGALAGTANSSKRMGPAMPLPRRQRTSELPAAPRGCTARCASSWCSTAPRRRRGTTATLVRSA
jgi:4-aminobutyrate aminotransferase-like enzyme